MLLSSTLNEICTNTNPGVEYEIAMFYCLLKNKPDEQTLIMQSINRRNDAIKVKEIIRYTNIAFVINTLSNEGLSFEDCYFATQDDTVGPSDIVMFVSDRPNHTFRLGLSVKFDNKNTLNPTARKFITDSQIQYLQQQFDEVYIPDYLEEMREKYGHISNWSRKRAEAAIKFYDLMRDAVIDNWPNVPNKASLLAEMFHSDSPIPFWVINYTKTGYHIETEPDTADESRANEVIVEKYNDVYVAFKLDGKILGKVQVKCNNGFIENQYNHAGKAKKKTPDFIIDGKPRIKGKPFGSWDFTLGQ